MPAIVNRTTGRQYIMPKKIMEQLKLETSTWKRLLDFFMEENVHAKNRMSDILKDDFDKNLLDELENFQSQFIKQDEVIYLLRQDITELDKLLLNKNNYDGISADLIEQKLESLRYNLFNSERQFCDLQLGFNRYLSKKII